MIVATAGHVDHGKTSLVRCLTGVDTDRLEEEKRRGLSINLGYAYLPTPHGLPIGFIDVPGHKRFINNMICGISGIDRGLLLVAADDGVMPQTLEHLDVLQLLGVEQLTIAISKADRASPERVKEVSQSVLALCETRGWTDPPLYPVSSTQGDGVQALKAHLLETAGLSRREVEPGCFRLSIDRAFNVKGTGLVVTGTVSTGNVQLNQPMRLTPGDKDVRVRGLRVHDAQATDALAGQRCAINLGGDVTLQDVERGNVLIDLQAGPASDRLDVTVGLLDSLSFPLKHMSRVKMHIGASRLSVKIALLDPATRGSRLNPGERAFAQLLLEIPLACTRSERFILRDDSGEVLLGGGHIINPYGEKPAHFRGDYKAVLQAMAIDDIEQALAARLALGQPVDIGQFEWACNLPSGTGHSYLPQSMQTYDADGRHWVVQDSVWAGTGEEIIAHLNQWHTSNPNETGIRAALLSKDLEKHHPSHLLRTVLGRCIQQQKIMLKEGLLSLASFKQQAAPELTDAWREIAGLMEKSGNNILLISELLDQTGWPQKKLQQVILDSTRKKQLHQVSERRYALPAQLAKLCHELMAFADTGNEITVKALKSHWGTGRNITVEILEYFDRIRFTQRRDNVRVILNAELPARLYNS